VKHTVEYCFSYFNVLLFNFNVYYCGVCILIIIVIHSLPRLGPWHYLAEMGAANWLQVSAQCSEYNEWLVKLYPRYWALL